MNFGQLLGGTITIAGAIASFLPFETAFNSGLIIVVGLGLYYLGSIDERLEKMDKNSADEVEQ